MNEFEYDKFLEYATDLIIYNCSDCPHAIKMNTCRVCTDYLTCDHPENAGVSYPIWADPDDCPLKTKDFNFKNIVIYEAWLMKTKGKLPFEKFIQQKQRLQKSLCFHVSNKNIKPLR